MIKTLLINGGKADIKTMEKNMLEYEFSHGQYYENITHKMMEGALKEHNIVEKKKNLFTLTGYDDLFEGEIHELILMCEEKIVAGDNPGLRIRKRCQVFGINLI